MSVIPHCRFKPNIKKKIGLKLADETQINSDGMINLSVKTVDGIDLSSHNFHVAKVKKSYLGMDLLKKLDAVIHVNEEHIACRNGLKIPFEKNNCEPVVLNFNRTICSPIRH